MVYESLQNLCYLFVNNLKIFYLSILTDSSLAVELEEILTKTMFINDLKKISTFKLYQTSSIEAFNALVLHFTPKNIHFIFTVMLARLVPL